MKMMLQLHQSHTVIIIAAAFLLPMAGAAAGRGHRMKKNRDPRHPNGNDERKMCGKGAYEFAETKNITYNNGDSYYGEINGEGRRHGKGVYRWPSIGEYYDGEWKLDLQHGFGELRYDNGGFRYSGEWHNGKEHGKGIFKGVNGDYYDGFFKFGVIHGKGILKFAVNGATYTGQHVNGQRTGFGIYEWKSGETYHGEWKHDARNGEGLQTSKWSIYTYRGPWRNDRKHGMGVEAWYGNFLVCDGEWNDGSPPPRGTCKCRLEMLQKFFQNTWHRIVEHYMMFIVILGFWIGLFFYRELADLKSKVSKLQSDWKPKARMKKESSFRSFLGRKNKTDARGDDDELIVELDQDYIQCGICYEDFAADMNSTNLRTREMLPIMGSCGHYFCHGCTIRWKVTVAGCNGSCPKCSKANQFDLLNPIYHRMLIDLLQRARPVEK